MEPAIMVGNEKYPFFRNHNKKRLKTISMMNTEGDDEGESMKQSIPMKLRRRNFIKEQTSNEKNGIKSIQGIDLRGKKSSGVQHCQTVPAEGTDAYKKYTEDFAIPLSSVIEEHNFDTIDPLNKQFKRDERSNNYQQQESSGEFRIMQQTPLHSLKKGSFSSNTNNRSYDHNKRSAAFSRKGLYSINSMEKGKKSTLHYYPADRYKSLTSKETLMSQQKSKSPYIMSNNHQYHQVITETQEKEKEQIENNKKNSFSITRNRYLLTKEDTKNNPYQSNTNSIKHTTSKKFRSHSNSNSHTQTIDNNLDKLIKKEFTSLSVKELNNDPVVRNVLDHMYLTEYEREEIRNYKDVYYIGHKAYLRKYKENQNFRDQKNNYKPIIGDHIAYRFEIVKILGSGAFGKVLEVIDHKSSDNRKKKYALKILKKSEDLYDQFKLEIKLLKIVKQNHEALKNIVEIKGDFEFRNHICIVTELLDLNVYAFIKNQEFEGLSLDITRKIMIQVLQALLFLHNKQIVHCDIKPENIVFKEEGKSGVKLVDFGSACFVDKKEFTYIQSRYYRSPEIVLVKPYDEKIDVWSTGCLAYEIFTGTPLFPARCEEEQMEMLKETLGPPPKHFLDKCERAEEFVFEREPPKFPISKRIDTTKVPSSFIDFMEKMVRWSPEERLTIKEALLHEFILEGLPEKVKKEHVAQMMSSNPYGLYENW